MATLLFECFVAMIPKGKGRHRTMKGGRTYPDPATVKAEQLIQMVVGAAWRKAPLDEPLALRVVAYFERPKSKPKKVLYPTGKPDHDNLDKTVGDSLNGILWRDDSVIVDGGCKKRYCSPDHPQPGLAIRVYALTEEDL